MLPRPRTSCLALQKDRLPATSTFRRQHATNGSWCIPISLRSIPLPPSTIKVARFLHVFVLGRNIQQLSHHWTEMHTCTAARQKVAECALSNLGPQRSRWQSFPHRTAQCKYSTSDSSPGSRCYRVHVPHALHHNRTGCLQSQHSEGNAQQTVAGACQRSRWQDFCTVFALGRNIQQLSHHRTETHTCTAARQKVAECTLSRFGPSTIKVAELSARNCSVQIFYK